MAILSDYNAQNCQRSERRQHEIHQGVLQMLGQQLTPIFIICTTRLN